MAVFILNRSKLECSVISVTSPLVSYLMELMRMEPFLIQLFMIIINFILR